MIVLQAAADENSEDFGTPVAVKEVDRKDSEDSETPVAVEDVNRNDNEDSRTKIENAFEKVRLDAMNLQELDLKVYGDKILEAVQIIFFCPHLYFLEIV
jgi:hypothetical protein